MKEHWIVIPRFVLHNTGCLTTTATRSGVLLTELLELLVELFDGTTAGFCRHKI